LMLSGVTASYRRRPLIFEGICFETLLCQADPLCPRGCFQSSFDASPTLGRYLCGNQPLAHRSTERSMSSRTDPA
jgi:hypothetical protein